MNKILISLIWFVSVFAFIYFLEILFINRKKEDKDGLKVSVEVKYLIYRYGIDVKKVSIKRLINDTSIIAAFDIAFVYSFVTYFITNVYLGLFLSFILLIPIILVSFDIVGKKYTKVKK